MPCEITYVKTCPDCLGLGTIAATLMPCKPCRGVGIVEVAEYPAATPTCPACSGSGRHMGDPHMGICNRCIGTGFDEPQPDRPAHGLERLAMIIDTANDAITAARKLVLNSNSLTPNDLKVAAVPLFALASGNLESALKELEQMVEDQGGRS